MFPSGRSRDNFSTGWRKFSNGISAGARRPYLGPGDTQEADGHEHPSDRDLVVAKLDSVEVLHAKTVRCDQTIQSKDLVHLDSSDEGASALPDDRSNYRKPI